MNKEIPTPGSIWQHHSGRLYTVLCVANTESLYADYPITIIYIGGNGNIWAKILANFIENMTETALGK